MASFLKAYSITKKHEGGYVDDPTDRGGETYKGIARNMHPKWRGWDFIDALKDVPNFPENLSDSSTLQKLVTAFFQAHFWDVNNLSAIECQGVANEVFDTGVNCGAGTAAKFLQQACNLLNRNGKNFPDLKVDGKIGRKSLKAVAECDDARLFKTLNILQGMRYINIVTKDPSQEKYFNGWLNRIDIFKTKTR